MINRILYFILYIFSFYILSINIAHSDEINSFTTSNIKLDYEKIIKIKPNIITEKIGKMNWKDWFRVSQSWKKELSKLDENRELKGYYAVLFIEGTTIFFVKLEKDGNIYRSRFITEEIKFDAIISEIEENYFKVDVDVNYKYNKLKISEHDAFGFIGYTPFTENIFILPNSEKNRLFAIYKL